MSFLALLLLALAPAGAIDKPTIDVHEREGESLCTIHARGARTSEVVREMCDRTNRAVVGIESLATADFIDIELVDRPWIDAIQSILGAAGYRARVTSARIEIAPDAPIGTAPAACEDYAEISFLHALREFPESPSASDAEFFLGELHESRGNLGAARGHYENLVKRHIRSALVPEALLRAGVLLEREREWGEAALRFSALANIDFPHALHARARLELARCYAKQGDGKQSMALLEVLERLYPTASATETSSRMYVKAAALAASGRHAEALAQLDEAGRVPAAEANTHDTLRLRAEVLEHVGMPAQASRAWLSAAQRITGVQRGEALLEAARTALAAGDALGVLFIERIAADDPIAERITPLAREASRKLGLAEPDVATVLNGRLERVRDLVDARSFREARGLLEPLLDDSAAFNAAQQTEAALLDAQILDVEVGLDAALAALRVTLDLVREPEQRVRIFVLAGELLEAHELYDRAIDAYGGRF